MKTNLLDKRKSRRGVALLLVLGSLVLMGALLLAFLGGIKGNMKTSKLYADGSSARALAESSVNLVMAQISQATSGTNQTWASQPGMIRVYDTSGTTAAECYKLYSWDELKTSGNFSASSNGVPTDWHQQKALFVDLNAPLMVSGEMHYPILNPPQTATISGSMKVEGFDVKGNAPLEPTSSNPNRNAAPMPVKWLYVLKNGEIATATASGTGAVTISGANAGNPIVGRIAFWTDDETCKININTASEGSYWATPLADDGYSWYMLAKRQPTQHEYQRYPGHPSTVSLSTVFSSVMPLTMPSTSGYGSRDAFDAIMPKYEEYERYYRLSPKLNKSTDTGSKAGSIQATGSITVKDDRLYASIEELQFVSSLPSAPGAANDPLRLYTPDGSGVRKFSTGSDGNPYIDEATLQKAKFFITTSNRSPDVNIFNKPRIVTWPMHKDSTKRTLFDRVLAFCGTVNDKAFYFQRERADSQDNDLNNIQRNKDLLAYLHNLTGLSYPGFANGNFQTKYGTDNDQILTEIFDYIRCLNLRDQSEGTNTFQFSKEAAWAASKPRGKQAAAGQVVPIYNADNDTRGFGRFPAVQEVALMFISSAWRNSGTLTINRDANNNVTGTTLSDTNDINYNALNNNMVYAGTGTGGGTRIYYGFDTTLDKNTIAIQAGLFFSFFDPSNGFPGISGSYRVKVSGLSSLKINGQPLFAQDTYTSIPPSNGGGQYTYTSGGNLGFRSFMAGYKASPSETVNGWYPFLSKELFVPYTPPNTVPPLQFDGGTLTMEIQVPSSSASSYSGAYEVVQTFEIKFDSITQMPTPTYPPRVSGNISRGQWGTRMDIGADEWTADARFICATDVVRSVRAMPGDMRVIAGRKRITWADNLYGIFKDEYDSSTERFAHSLIEAGGFPFYGAILGQLVKGLAFENKDIYDKRHILKNDDDLIYAVNAGNIANSGSSSGVIPSQTGAYLRSNGTEYPGDWDNGVGYMPDGPYINKADEGTLHKRDGTGELDASGEKTPYFTGGDFYAINNLGALITPTFFSPNRMMPSPVMFGSLSTGVKRNLPWQTLLFSPNPAAGDRHPGFATPPDHLLLDLFHMPVVEPYPISEPLSTDGRINMNYQIVPFTYIERSTGVRAVLKQQRMFMVPDSVASKYKHRYGLAIGQGAGSGEPIYGLNCWPLIDVDKTLGGFSERFDANDIFRSASEICTLFLYPKFKAADSAPAVPASYDTDAIKRFWQGTEGIADGHKITGDNGRERPYSIIYPLLTTKSNTYMVHMWVQKLQKTPTTDPDKWVEGRDQVLSEYRGSSTIERYVDPNDTSIPDFALPAHYAKTLNPYYKFRVLRTSQFAP